MLYSAIIAFAGRWATPTLIFEVINRHPDFQVAALPYTVCTWDERVICLLNIQGDNKRIPLSLPTAQPLPWHCCSRIFLQQHLPLTRH